jgi:hypothetical protein
MVHSREVLFFFGAGASAPFGIPTMKQFVTDFEMLLDEEATKDEWITYTSIKEKLEKRLKREADLEAVFSVIDGLLNYNQERLGFLSLYSATDFNVPNEVDRKICTLLRERFQNFVREKCTIAEESFGKIAKVYHDFFNRFALEFGGETRYGPKYLHDPTWTIFTTNYDLCLEYYWREVTRIGIDTGFGFNKERNVTLLTPHKLLEDGIGLQLFKLHGSVDWLVEKGTNDVIEVDVAKGRSHLGRKYEGEMMIYPVAEKELYADPYISMLLRLNRELERKSIWVVIGYSFNDPIIRELFLRRSKSDKHLILVHSDAEKVWNDRLSTITFKVSRLEKKFGLEDTFREVNHQIIHKLKENPRFGANEMPLARLPVGHVGGR